MLSAPSRGLMKAVTKPSLSCTILSATLKLTNTDKMDNTQTQTSEHFAVVDVPNNRYFKGEYDDGCLIGFYFVDEAVRATPFNSIDRANNAIDELTSRYSMPVLSIVKVETVSKISFID